MREVCSFGSGRRIALGEVALILGVSLGVSMKLKIEKANIKQHNTFGI